VVTRTTTQVRSHAQKYYAKIAKKVDQVSSGLEIITDMKEKVEPQTQTSTPAVSPSGGPCVNEKVKTKCPVKKESEEVLKNADIPNIKNATIKRTISSNDFEKSILEPDCKHKICAAQTDSFPPCLNLPTATSLSMSKSLFFQPSYEVPYYKQINCENYEDFAPNFADGSTGLGQKDANSEAEAWDLDHFSLDPISIKPLDLGDVEQEKVKQNINYPNEGLKFDFSGIF